jgi:hypothetical protein
MARVPIAQDAGVGDAAAEPGTPAWARFVRLISLSDIKELQKFPERVRAHADDLIKHKAWALLNKPDGSAFKSWEEFCAHPQPYGWGRPWAEIRPIIEAAIGRPAATVLTAENAEPLPPPRPGAPKGNKNAAKQPVLTLVQGKHEEQPEQSLSDNHCSEQTRGTGSDYLTRRIARDAPEVLERMKAGEFKSVRQAARAAGIVKDPPPVEKVVRALDRLSPAQRADFFERVEHLRLDAQAYRMTGGMS